MAGYSSNGSKWQHWKKAVFIAVAVAIVAAIIINAMQPTVISVDTEQVTERELVVTVQEQGRTRARLPYTVTAPVNGQLLRTNLIEGDQVDQGQVIARIALAPEDQRTEATLRANLAAAEARHAAAEAALNEAESALERAESEADRRRRLFEQRMIGEEERDLYQQNVQAAQARLLSARASLNAALADVESARSRLIGIDSQNSESVREIVSPVTGTVQRVHERNERIVPAGTELFQISDADALELVIDLLTQDAVNVSPGDEIRITGWGGGSTLRGQVEYIEPEAFTKFSALGVEEQRVNVIGQLLDDNSNLGAEYRIQAAVVTWQEQNVLTVPTSALFRRDGGWQVFVIDDDTARLRSVETGQRSREYAEVLTGLQNGDQVIVFPSDQIADGVLVTPSN